MLAHNLSAPSAWEPFSSKDYEWFTQKVFQKFNIRLSDYKQDQMQRRLGTLASQRSALSFTHYFACIEKDSTLLNEFLDQMTINVTELLRNPSLFEKLAGTVIPSLLAARKGAPLAVWSAGCSYGAEAVTVAMLLSEINPVPQFKITATDLDLAVLAKANTLMFNKPDMASISLDRRRKHFIEIDENTFMPRPAIKQSISFSRQDLLSEDYPRNAYDLILCRNVIIYFTDEAKDRVFKNFWKALRPGGILFVGGTERLSDAKSLQFEAIEPFIYRALNK